MSQDQKTAIKLAEEMLDKERKEKLQREVYDYLKQELDCIDDIEQKLNKLKTEKTAHEENIKNIKQGNLEAIEKRRQSFPFTTTFTTTWPSVWTTYNGTGTNFYNGYVAGITITNSSGKTYIF